jgi:hypothetical protein
MRAFVVGGCLLFGVGCVDPGRNDRAFAELEVVRREVATREGSLRAVEERQNALNQQMALIMAMAGQSFSRDPRREDERDRRLALIAERVEHLDAVLTRLREDDVPTPIDIAAARRAAETGSEEERAAAVRKVQALLDAGQVKVTVRNGRMQLSLIRPLDGRVPQGPKVVAPAKVVDPDKDKLKDLLDSR